MQIEEKSTWFHAMKQRRQLAKAQTEAYNQLYEDMETKEGEKEAYRVARQRDEASKDVQQVRVIKDAEGNYLVENDDILKRWKEYFEELMNGENDRERRTEAAPENDGEASRISKEEVKKVMAKMKRGKAVGPDDIPVEAWRCLGDSAVHFLTGLFNRVLQGEGMPEEWRRSTLVPIYKNKGDAQSCTNYHGIKLMSHTMEMWERVVEGRLMGEVAISEHHYGFMPGKCTTDAIFALKILAEKYREGQKELHYVFIDLEKAYDRVARDQVWQCLRQAGTKETYVRVIQDMYLNCETVVRCVMGENRGISGESRPTPGISIKPFLVRSSDGCADR